MKAQLYAQATGRVAQPVPPNTQGVAEQELSFQAKADWLQHNNTIKLFKELAEKANALEAQARAQATSYHQHQNPHLATKCLIVADELRNIIQQYGSLA